MTEPTAEMHRTFLREIRQKRTALQKELETLEAVEQYHAQRAENSSPINDTEQLEISVAPVSVPSGHENDEDKAKLRTRLKGKTKHDAAAVALKHLGKPARVGELIKILQENGYAKEMKRRVLHNSLYTAMNRREDLFVRTAKGFWGLAEWNG